MESLVGKPGTRLRSAVSTVEVIVVRPAARETILECSGQPMVAADVGAATDGSADGDQVLLGKRYSDEPSGLEVLRQGGVEAAQYDCWRDLWR